MPRKARIGAPGALHHLIVRGKHSIGEMGDVHKFISCLLENRVVRGKTRGRDLRDSGTDLTFLVYFLDQ